MAGQDIAGKVLKGLNSFVDNAQWNGKSILRSNEAINKVGKFVMGESDTGIRGALGGLAKGEGFTDAVKGAYMNGDKVNWKAVGGTYVGAAAAGRVLTGGGVYRDSTGNVNVPVVPFM